MSLKDSGTKGKRLLWRLSALLFAVLSVTLGSVSAFAEAASSGQAGAFSSGFENLPENASLTERLVYGLKVAGIGLLVVFLVLIIIMAILYIFKVVALSKSKAASAATPAASAASASAASASVPSAAAPAPAASAASGSEEETIVAIATAAIAASRGAGDCAFRVISVTKIQ